MTDDRLDWYLENWADHEQHGQVGRGYGKQAVGLQSNASQDFEEMCERADQVCADATDAVIKGLELNEQCAISHQYLNAVWRFRERFEDLLARARFKVRQGLEARHFE